MLYTIMMTNISSTPGKLSDQEVLDRVRAAAQDERCATVQLVALLMELDTRRLYLGEGCSSLFTYCIEVLHLSEHAAYNRIQAARAARRFPLILERLADGSIHLTAVRLLEPHLTPENHRDVLDAAKHQSKRAIEELIARLHPQPDVLPSVRKLPTPATARTPVEKLPAETLPPVESASLPPALPTPARQTVVSPLAPERYKVQFTVSKDTHDKLRRVQDLLRHRIPNGDPAAIFDLGLTALLSELKRTKLAAAKRPRKATISSASRHVPAAAKRAVWARDGGRCAFVGAQGRCSETGFLEFHHRVPYAAGGETSVENLELRCRAHNAYEAERYFEHGQPLFARERCDAAWHIAWTSELVPERAETLALAIRQSSVVAQPQRR